MITLNDYLYSGDTIFRILQKYTTDLRKDAKKHRNEIDMMHCNFLVRVVIQNFSKTIVLQFVFEAVR